MRRFLASLLVFTLLLAVQIDVVHASDQGHGDMPVSAQMPLPAQTDMHQLNADESCCETTGAHANSCLSDIANPQYTAITTSGTRIVRFSPFQGRTPVTFNPDGLIDPPKA